MTARPARPHALVVIRGGAQLQANGYTQLYVVIRRLYAVIRRLFAGYTAYNPRITAYNRV